MSVTTGPDFKLKGDQIKEATIESFHWADPNVHYYLFDDFMMGSLINSSFATEATLESPISAIGGVWRLETNGANAKVSVSTNILLTPVDPTKQLKLLWKFATIDITNIIYFVGLIDVFPTTAIPPVEPPNGLYFRRSDTGVTGNWEAVARNGGTETFVDTQIVGDLLQHIFIIRINEDGSAEFFIDGISKAKISTNIPTALLNAALLLITQGVPDKGFDVDTILLWGKR